MCYSILHDNSNVVTSNEITTLCLIPEACYTFIFTRQHNFVELDTSVVCNWLMVPRISDSIYEIV